MIKDKAIQFVFGLFKECVCYSYWICLLTAMIATILYVSGLKKAGKYIPVMMVIYFLLECLKDCISEIY